jgi:hypothetical protein
MRRGIGATWCARLAGDAAALLATLRSEGLALRAVHEWPLRDELHCLHHASKERGHEDIEQTR